MFLLCNQSAISIGRCKTLHLKRIFELVILGLYLLCVAACSGGGGGGGSPGKTVTSTSATYSGSTETIVTTYSDGSTSTHTVVGTLSSPTFSPNGSQKTLNYVFPDGTTHAGAALVGTPTTPSYNAGGSQKTLNYSFSDGTTHSGQTLTGTPSTTWANDHITRTITYTFSDSTTNAVTSTVPPTLSAPTLTQAVYPADWATGISSGAISPPATSAVQNIYGDGTTATLQDGTIAKPFQQSSLTPNGPAMAGAITDPNGNVTSPTGVTYNLNWGTPDSAGPGYVTTWYGLAGTATEYTFPNAVMIAGHSVSGQSGPTSGMTLATPVPDAKTAWSQGWTGKLQNILLIDGYPDPSNKPPSMTQIQYEQYYSHGITNYLIASRYARSANFYVYDANGLYDDKIHDSSTNAVSNFLANTHGNLANSVRSASGFYFDVVNISMGYNYWENSITNPTQTQIDAAFAEQAAWTNSVSQLLDGTSSASLGALGSATPYFTDSVITKAAMNDHLSVEKDPLNSVLANNLQIWPRLLIVGALDMNGTSGTNGSPGTATIAGYSNTAGADLKFQSRFLLASGGAPYSSNGVAIDGTNVSSGSGTSYAAPRIAGYAAIIRQKFPNLTAPNTAEILLSTARYDTLTCYPNCNKAIYGQGEASLSRALAPVGYLR